jgi:hypothetical protein
MKLVQRHIIKFLHLKSLKFHEIVVELFRI